MTFFDHFASDRPTALGRMFGQKAAALLSRQISKVEPKPGSLLEIGPGRGEFCDIWQQRGGAVTALEANPAMGGALAAKGMRVIHGLAPPLPFGNDQFDVVVASHVLEHMPTVLQSVELVEEMKRVCSPGGVLCIVAPDVRTWRLDFWNADYTHNYVTSPRRVEQLFRNVDLTVERVLNYSGFVTGPAGWFLSVAARLFPARALDAMLPASLGRGKFYKLKLTFLGNFLIVGRKN